MTRDVEIHRVLVSREDSLEATLDDDEYIIGAQTLGDNMWIYILKDPKNPTPV